MDKVRDLYKKRIGVGWEWSELPLLEHITININNRHIFSHQLSTICHLDEPLTINMLCSGTTIFVKQVYILKFKKLLFVHSFIQLISLLSLSSLGAPPTSSLGAPPTSLRGFSCPALSKLLTASSLRTLNNFLPRGFSGSPHLWLLSPFSLRALLTLLPQGFSRPPHSKLLTPSSLRTTGALPPASFSHPPPSELLTTPSEVLSTCSLRFPLTLLPQTSSQAPSSGLSPRI